MIASHAIFEPRFCLSCQPNTSAPGRRERWLVILFLIVGLCFASAAMPVQAAGHSGVTTAAAGVRRLFVSSYQCFVPGCSYESAVLMYDGQTGAFLAPFIENLSGPYGMAIHPLRGTLIVVSRVQNAVLEFDPRSGEFLRTLVAAGPEGLHAPQSILFRPDGRLLVTSTQTAGHFDKFNGILEFDGNTGAFQRPLVDGGYILADSCLEEKCLRGPNSIAPGPTGQLYVTSGLNNLILEYDVESGILIDYFDSTELVFPEGLVVRPATQPRAGNLLVTSTYRYPGVPNDWDKILEFDHVTHELINPGSVFANGMESPGPMCWHMDGSLLVADRLLWDVPPYYSDRIIQRSGLNGTYMGMFTPAADTLLHFATGLLETAIGFATGDENGNGAVDLWDFAGFQRAFGGSATSSYGVFDDNLNARVDLADFQALVGLWSGPNRPCSLGADCADDNACTEDQCVNQRCSYTTLADGTPCADAYFCNGSEACQSGLCTGRSPCLDESHCDELVDRCLLCISSVECDDDNVCTTDTCSNGACSYVANSLACDDQNPCTVNEACLGGLCVGGAPANCDDSEVCTTDLCDSRLGCMHVHNAFACEDGDPCTSDDSCLFGGCRPGPPTDCSDDNDCTTDACDPAIGCFSVAHPGLCDDGDPCTLDDLCVEGTCTPGATLDCDDRVDCTTDSCAAGACAHTGDDAACDDGLACNGVERCDAVSGCLAGTPLDCDDAVSCTIDSCDLVLDACRHDPDDTLCDDGLYCNGDETCHVTTGCHAGAPPDCDDQVNCTLDSCDETSATCTHTPQDAACDDGVFCNGAERCLSTGCSIGIPPACDDGVACTVDSCDAVLNACRYDPDDAACDDGVYCNGTEVCTVGAGCQSGPLPCPGQQCDEAADTCAECLNNLLQDPGFEGGGVGWLKLSNPGRSLVNTEAHTGSWSEQMVVDDHFNRDVYQPVVVQPGQTFQAAVWIKTLAVDGNGTTLRLFWYDTAATLLRVDYAGSLSGTSDWTQIGGFAVAPPGAATVQFALYTGVEPDDAGVAWFDDALFCQVQ